MQMLRTATIAALVALGGCNHENSEETASDDRRGKSEYSEAPEAITDGGIIVFNESSSEIDLPSRETLDRWWSEVQQCVEMESEPPNVIVTNDVRETCPQTSGSQGHYCEAGGSWYVVILADRMKWGWLWKHEFMHHLFRANNAPEHQDHEPGWLWQCQYS